MFGALICDVRRRALRRGPTMLFLKCCPRCKGDIYLDKDTYGVFIECLQCGFSRDLPDTIGKVPAEEPDRAEELVARPVAVTEEQLRRAS